MKGFSLIVIVFLLFACNSKKRIEQEEQHISSSTNITTTSAHLDVKSYLGKYPNQIQLFEREPLHSRLKNILGNEFDDFIKNWNTETPIEKEGTIFHTSGCKANDCTMNSFDLFVDTHTNTINVYHIKNGRQRIYKEDNREIELPKKYQSNIELKRTNASLEVLPPRYH